MPAQASADAEKRSPAGDFVRHPVLAVFRPSVLAVLAIFLALALPDLFTDHARLLRHACLGVLVLGMYFWQFARHQPSFMEAVGIFLIGFGFQYVMINAAFTAAACILLLAVTWLVMTWIARRWPLLRGLTTLTIFLLVLQVSFRAAYPAWQPESHRFFHRSLDLVSFSLLMLIAFTSSRAWHEQRLILPPSRLVSARLWSASALLALGAGHVLTDRAIPGFPAYASHAVALLVMIVAWKSRLWLWQSPHLRWLSPALLIMPLNQMVLGFYLAHGSHPSPWMPTLMAVNGLAILGLVVVMNASVWAAHAPAGLQGEQLTAGKSPPAV